MTKGLAVEAPAFTEGPEVSVSDERWQLGILFVSKLQVVASKLKIFTDPVSLGKR